METSNRPSLSSNTKPIEIDEGIKKLIYDLKNNISPQDLIKLQNVNIACPPVSERSMSKMYIPGLHKLCIATVFWKAIASCYRDTYS